MDTAVVVAAEAAAASAAAAVVVEATEAAVAAAVGGIDTDPSAQKLTQTKPPRFGAGVCALAH